MKTNSQYFERNCNALMRFSPGLVAALKAAPDWSGHAEEVEGGYTVRLNGDSGPWVTSRRAPVKEAERIAAAAKPELTQPIVLLGVGSGAVITACRSKYPLSPVIVVENRLPLLKLFLSTHDCGKAIGEHMLLFPVDVEGQAMADVLTPQELALSSLSFTHVRHPYTNQQADYGTLNAEFHESVTLMVTRMASRVSNYKATVANILNNLPHLLQSKGVKPFKGVLKGVPGVLIASGPSLDRALPVLREHSDKAFFIAASSALHRAKRAGVEVHACNVVDYHHLSNRYFLGLGEDAPPLFAKPAANYDVMDEYPGVKLMSDDSMFKGVLRDQFEERGEVGEVGGLNVSHHSFQVLRFLGCNPIIMVGQDLAYSHHVTHAPGTAILDEVMGSVNRFASLDQMELMNVVSPQARSTVLDQTGNPIGSCVQWDRAAKVFEQWFKKYPDTRVINASLGGRDLRGTEVMPIKRVFEEVANKQVDLSPYWQALKMTAPKGVSEDVPRGVEVLREADLYTRSVAKAMRKVRGELERAVETMEAGREANADSAKAEIQEKLKEYPGVSTVVSALAAGELLEWNKLYAKTKNESLPVIMRRKIRAQADLAYTKGFQRALAAWAMLLERAIARAEIAAAGGSLADFSSSAIVPTSAADDLVTQETVVDQDTQTITSRGAWRALIGSVQRKNVDAVVDMPDHPQVVQYVIGTQRYSPLQITLKSLLASPDVREILVPWEEAWGTPPILGERLHYLPAPKDKDFESRPIANRLRAWNHAGSFYGLRMSIDQGTYGNPNRMLKLLGDLDSDAVVQVPWHSGFMTTAAVQALIEQAVETGFVQRFYLSEGPVGLLPTLWMRSTIDEVSENGIAMHTVFQTRGTFWGPDLAYSSPKLKACRRNFDLRTVRGRNSCEALAYRLGQDFDFTHPDALDKILDAANEDWDSWVGGLPQDIEIELTNQRELNPVWLPDMKREPAQVSFEDFKRWMDEIEAQRSDVNLTLGGFGDPLLHPQLIGMLRYARPRVRGLAVRTFGTRLDAKSFEDIANAGVDAVCVRFGAWGPEEYAKSSGADLMMQIGGIFSQLGNWMMQNQVHMPILVPEVVRQKDYDHQLLSFWDAWWSPASWPMVQGFNTYGGELENQQELPLFPGERRPCLRLTEQMLVLADGRVPLCVVDHAGEHPVANIKMQSIASAWRSDGFQEVRQAHIEGDYGKHAACENCQEWCRLG